MRLAKLDKQLDRSSTKPDGGYIFLWHLFQRLDDNSTA
jgi:hypothetical protein